MHNNRQIFKYPLNNTKHFACVVYIIHILYVYRLTLTLQHISVESFHFNDFHLLIIDPLSFTTHQNIIILSFYYFHIFLFIHFIVMCHFIFFSLLCCCVICSLFFQIKCSVQFSSVSAIQLKRENYVYVS